jgi:signal transduction histidine kinase
MQTSFPERMTLGPASLPQIPARVWEALATLIANLQSRPARVAAADASGAEATLISLPADIRLRGAVSAMEDGFGLFDAEDRIVLHNAAFMDEGSRRAFGDDVTGRKFEEIVRAFAYHDMPVEGPGFDREAWIAQRMERHRNPPPHPIEVKWGGGRWMRISERRTADGGYVGIWTDISIQKQREAELQAAKDALEVRSAELVALTRELELARNAANEANRGKSQFLANMSHELRTPLNAINGFSELMLKEALGPIQPAKYGEYVDYISQSGRHLLSLLNDILDLSKVEAGKMELNVEAVPTQQVAYAAIEGVRTMAAERGVGLKTSIDVKCPILHADPRALRQVLLNLLSNAVKFTPSAGSVALAFSWSDAGVDIAVIDTGIGMTENEVSKALELYGQVESDLARKQSGSGLGLPIAKALTELHGGRLTLISEKDRGTTAKVNFPWHPHLPARQP